MLTTYVWRIDLNGKRTRMQVIQPGSKFRSLKVPKGEEMLKPEVQKELAAQIIQGWKQNGPYPPSTKWEITQDNGEQAR